MLIKYFLRELRDPITIVGIVCNIGLIAVPPHTWHWTLLGVVLLSVILYMAYHEAKLKMAFGSSNDL